MQTREMWNRNKWRVVAGAATLTALGVTGLALADADDDTIADSIALEDLVTMDTFDSPDVVVVDDNTNVVSDLDSPLDDDAASVASAEDSPDEATGTDSPDVESPDSPDVESPDSPDVESPDSPDVESPDSPDDDDTSS
jgi:hypothetical protein